jgi:rubrerythrin
MEPLIEVKHLNEINSPEDLMDYLKAALQLEHATIPIYLTALYSIHPDKNIDARNIIRVVMLEEMLHLTLVANILNAVGGKPDLTEKDFVPTFPTYLPNGETDFEVSLLPFSETAIEMFLNIERPHAPLLKLAVGQYNLVKRDTQKNFFLPPVMSAGSTSSMHFATIGEFYRAIEEGLTNLCEKLGEKNVFTGDEKKQISDDKFWGGGGKVYHVNDLASAKKAINLIIEQGEGDRFSIYDDEADEEISHYYRFQQLQKKRYYQKGDKINEPTGPVMEVDFSPQSVCPIKPNCRITDFANNKELEDVANEFNAFYKKFLAKITDAFNGKPDDLTAAVGEMFRIRDKALVLMRNPLPSEPKLNGAPTFEVS